MVVWFVTVSVAFVLVDVLVGFQYLSYSWCNSEARTKGDARTIHSALIVYEAANGVWPTTEQGLQALVDRPTTDPLPRNWQKLLEQVPRDPWDRPYVYRFTGLRNPPPDPNDAPPFQIISFGPDRIESGDDLRWP
jgi:general secretion pathway protein G